MFLIKDHKALGIVTEVSFMGMGGGSLSAKSFTEQSDISD
jgi:hypothetical protein